jgi:hypothetical protein
VTAKGGVTVVSCWRASARSTPAPEPIPRAAHRSGAVSPPPLPVTRPSSANPAHRADDSASAPPWSMPKCAKTSSVACGVVVAVPSRPGSVMPAAITSAPHRVM